MIATPGILAPEPPRHRDPIAGPPAAAGRRGDLDALRGFAMMLGIVLHASLAYAPFPWPVQDPRQARSLGLVFVVIHGFRMPLFFLLSGFFTMLVLERRGLRSLLRQRALRILLPLVISAVTILPLNHAAMAWATRTSSAASARRSPLSAAIVAGDRDAVARTLAAAPPREDAGAAAELTPLALAAVAGDPAIVAALLDAGGRVDATNRDGSTPLHAAALFGRAEVVAVLLARGADPTARTMFGQTPLETLSLPAEVAIVLGRFLGLPDRTEAELEAGRAAVRAQLEPLTPVAGRRPAGATVAARYHAALADPRLSITLFGRPWQVFQRGFLDHLWFLWFLCWLVAAFALADVLGLRPTGRFRWWLIPASCLTFTLMWSPFGPDTATGLVPTPHLLAFYACFFWFGAATYAAEGADTPLGRRWPVLLPLAVCVLLPAALVTIGDRGAAAILQPAYAWAMSLGLIGLFQRCFSRERPAIRWLADASYWMYLVHLPLVFVVQTLLRERPWPAPAKFLTVMVVVTAIAAVTYRYGVRFTPIGWMLNGPRPARMREGERGRERERGREGGRGRGLTPQSEQSVTE